MSSPDQARARPLDVETRIEVGVPENDERSLRFLVKAGDILSASLDLETTLGNLAALAVPSLADWCVIDLLDDEGRLRRIATTHSDPRKSAYAREMDRRYPPRNDSPAGPASVLRTGRPECVPSIPESLLRALAEDDEHFRIVQELGLHSYICVPLAARGRNLGAITLIQAESGREYGPDDLLLAEDLARRAAVAVDNARLFQLAQRELSARQEAESLLADQKSLLARIATGAPLAVILNAITGLVEGRDPSLKCSVLLLDRDGRHLRFGAAPNLPDPYNRAIDGLEVGRAVGSCGTAAFLKQRVIVSDIASDPLWAAFKDLAAAHNLAACWSSPAIAEDGTVLGTVAIYAHEPRTPTPLQLELLETATYLAGIAIQRSRTEAALEQSRRWFSMTLGSIGDAVIATDAEGRVAYMNAVAQELTGWTGEEAKGLPCRTVFNIINQDDRTEVESPVDRVLREGRVVSLANHTLLVARDGGEIPIDDSGAPIRDEDGNLIGIVLVFRDITERARAEEQRRRAQTEAEVRARQHRALAELGIRAFSTTSLQEWMQEAAETVARTLDVEFCKVLELLSSGHLLLKAGVGWREGLVGNTTMPTGNHSQGGYSLMVDEPVVVEDLASDGRFDGPSLLSEHGVVSGVSVLVYQGDGRRWGVVGAHTRRRRRFTSDDVAFVQSVANLMGLVLERNRQREEVERGAREIAALNKRLQRSIAETHHRVKNNLQVISAMVEMQAMRDDEAIPASEIQRLGQHVRGLAAIHDLLTLEARDNGTVDNLSAKEAVEKLMPLLQTMIGARRIHARVEDVRLPIRQSAGLAILVNELVSNAMKHGKGDITIDLAHLPDRPGWAGLDVCDDGPGFPPDFDPRKAANTGLDLIESVGRWDLQGDVTYLNRPEGGACVRILFPVAGTIAS